MNKQTTLIALGLALLVIALFGAYLRSLLLYGIAMYWIGFIAAVLFLIKIEEQDDDSN
jgi:fatty acid desaturase